MYNGGVRGRRERALARAEVRLKSHKESLDKLKVYLKDPKKKLPEGMSAEDVNQTTQTTINYIVDKANKLEVEIDNLKRKL